ISHPGLWPHWFNTFARRNFRPVRELTFEVQNTCMQAAASGLGVAIGPSGALVDDIACGKLTLPFPRFVSRSNSYYVLHPLARGRKEAAKAAFFNWLVEEGARSSALYAQLVEHPAVPGTPDFS